MVDDTDEDIQPDPDDLEEEEFAEPELGEDVDDDAIADELADIDELGDDLGEDDFVDVLEDSLDVHDVLAAVEEPRPRVRTEDKEDEDEDEVDPDDVEADLDTILKDRLEAYDETAEDDEEEPAGATTVEEGDLPSKREGEFPCPSCFLLVSAKQVARTGNCPHCGDPIQIPVGI